MITPTNKPTLPLSDKLPRPLKRFAGRIYGPYNDFLLAPERYGGKRSAHIEAAWTWPDHFAHNNYERGHLPQICVIASGWKARLLSLFFWPKELL